MADENVCMVCIEPFTKQPHKKRAKCPYCDVMACVKCTQTYLIGSTEDPHCMGCRKAWSRTVMDELLLSTWLNGEYKKKREDILLDRERSRLPAAQVIIERKKEADKRAPNLTKLNQELVNLQHQIYLTQQKIDREAYIIHELRAGREPPITETTNTTEQKTNESKRVFTMPCPASGCRGFLSTAYKCGVCDIYCCSQCRDIKGKVHDAPHTCNPDTLKTVEALKKQCRNCPECGASIFRIEGCSQMFCTNCNTPFDWNTGKKVTNGAIHNPHYFEYLRKVGGGVMPRTPGDIPCGGRLPDAYVFDRHILRLIDTKISEQQMWLQAPMDPEKAKEGKEQLQSLKKLQEIAKRMYVGLRNVVHLQHVEIPRYTNNAEDADNTEYNVRYLTKEIDEKRWKQLLQQKEKRRMKKDEIRQVIEAFCATCVDIYAPLLNLSHQEIVQDTNINAVRNRTLMMMSVSYPEFERAIQNAHNQLQTLRNIFLQGMSEISARYNCQVPTLNEKLAITTEKFSKSDCVEIQETAKNVLVQL